MMYTEHNYLRYRDLWVFLLTNCQNPIYLYWTGAMCFASVLTKCVTEQKDESVDISVNIH